MSSSDEEELDAMNPDSSLRSPLMKNELLKKLATGQFLKIKKEKEIIKKRGSMHSTDIILRELAAKKRY